MAYGHTFPWQLVTRALDVDLAFRLPLQPDAEGLRSELDAILRAFSPKVQHGRYHDGGWQAIGLIALNGDYSDDRPTSDAYPGRYEPTEVLELAPHMRQVIESLEAPKQRARLMQMAPGAQIFWHFDRAESLESKNVRLHFPVVTNPQIQFQISHSDLHWEAGSAWYGDFSFPHRLWNQSDQARVHLVVDLEVNDWIRSLFSEEFLAQARRRATARRLCAGLYNSAHPTNVASQLPQPLRNLLRRAKSSWQTLSAGA